jgi:hypothetical protein
MVWRNRRLVVFMKGIPADPQVGRDGRPADADECPSARMYQ